MPEISEYKCNRKLCGFRFPSGWGGTVYAEDEKGNRIVSPHPGQDLAAARALANADESVPLRDSEGEATRARIGFNSCCVCLDCLYQFLADFGNDEQASDSWRYLYGATEQREERKCPHCNSPNVKTAIELVGKTCPKCKKGTIIEIKTGFHS